MLYFEVLKAKGLVYDLTFTQEGPLHFTLDLMRDGIDGTHTHTHQRTRDAMENASLEIEKRGSWSARGA